MGKSGSLYWELPAPDGKEGALREQNTFIVERYCTTVVRTTRELHLDSVSISVRVGVHTVVRPLLSLVYSICLPPLRRQHRKRLYVPKCLPDQKYESCATLKHDKVLPTMRSHAARTSTSHAIKVSPLKCAIRRSFN